MSSIQIKNISKNFDDVKVLSNISLTIDEGELFFLLGPSGCGKTTLLRILAGFERPDSGEIYFGDKKANDIPAQNRNTSLVFQNYALWPHLTVWENVAYGLQTRKMPKAKIEELVDNTLLMVQMSDYKKRTPNQLSGGQQQRVALARALVVKPELLLFDEPLSNLDARLRAEMRKELLQVHKSTGITSVYVTHDQEEAFTMADKIAVMDHGQIVQIGKPRDLYLNPLTVSIAKFLGHANIIEGKIIGLSDKEVHIETCMGNLTSKQNQTSTLHVGKKALCFFRPEFIKTTTENFNNIAGIILDCRFSGGFEHITLECNGTAIDAIVPMGKELFAVGSPFNFNISPEHIRVLEAQ